jgi:hypothetical protein
MTQPQKAVKAHHPIGDASGDIVDHQVIDLADLFLLRPKTLMAATQRLRSSDGWDEPGRTPKLLRLGRSGSPRRSARRATEGRTKKKERCDGGSAPLEPERREGSPALRRAGGSSSAPDKRPVKRVGSSGFCRIP